MTDKNVALEACSDAVSKALADVKLEHDGRLVFACLGAEFAYFGAMLKAANVYSEETIIRVMTEALITALTRETKPKISYFHGDEDLGSKQ